MERIAKIISNIFQPLLIPTYSVLLLFQAANYATFFSFSYKFYTVLTIFILTAIIPLVAILILKKMGIVSSIQLPERKERLIPYIVTIICYITAIAFLWRIYMPIYIVAMMLGVLLAVVTVSLINFKWKISAHLCAMGSLTAAILVVSLRLQLNPTILLSWTFIFSGVVAAARMILNIHTPMQTLAGFATGFAYVFALGLYL